MKHNLKYDLIIKNVNVVQAQKNVTESVDIAIKDGKIAALEFNLCADDALEIHDGKGQSAFPGVVDAHMHIGIYHELSWDAYRESQACAQGGVTTSLNYMRTGKYYLNKSGSYANFFPEVLALSKGQFHVDYGFHLAPMSAEHIDEIPMLVSDFGVTSFKIFMFYGGHGLHGASSNQRDFLMIGPEDRYDIAHFEFIMRKIANLQEERPHLKEHLSLSLHCETAEIMTAYTKLVESEGKLSGLRAYSASRPQHSEGMAIWMASYLANETNCVNINLLHLTSRKALDAALKMQKLFPHISFKREVTLGHLLLDVDSPGGLFAKVNPPIRPREDVEALWESLIEGDIDWVVSDHACCSHEQKIDARAPKNIFAAKSGFGGTEYLLTGLITEGKKRGLSKPKIAQLLSLNPSRRYGLPTKGDIAVGLDADIALVDTENSYVVQAKKSFSSAGYSCFDGMEFNAKVSSTYLRGEIVYSDGKIRTRGRGQFIARPHGLL